MPRQLKVFRAHLGFYDTVVAAASQKAALHAWGSAEGEFRQGFASVTTDADAVAAALKRPGVPLYRLFGSNEPFAEKARSGGRATSHLKAIAAADAKRGEEERKRRAEKTARYRKEAEGFSVREERRTAVEEAKRKRRETAAARIAAKRQAGELKRARQLEWDAARKRAKTILDEKLRELGVREREIARERREAKAAYEAIMRERP